MIFLRQKAEGERESRMGALGQNEFQYLLVVLFNIIQYVVVHSHKPFLCNISAFRYIYMQKFDAKSNTGPNTNHGIDVYNNL